MVFLASVLFLLGGWAIFHTGHRDLNRAALFSRGAGAAGADGLERSTARVLVAVAGNAWRSGDAGRPGDAGRAARFPRNPAREAALADAGDPNVRSEDILGMATYMNIREAHAGLLPLDADAPCQHAAWQVECPPQRRPQQLAKARIQPAASSGMIK